MNTIYMPYGAAFATAKSICIHKLQIFDVNIKYDFANTKQ